ncbi:MAG: O-antigen ligase family protein [Phaeodactylibacter sp.]|uniref:O-antigen ligase family protein n=1 Tax=Phaeodactylibacter sp. TaxID=1940289 RepID=UPI0032EF56A0
MPIEFKVLQQGPFPQPVHHQWLGMACLIAMMVGMMTSAEALISIAFIALVVNVVLNRQLPQLWKRFLRHPALLGITGIFLMYTLSGLYSENTVYLFRRLRTSLPLLLLPFAILSLPRFGKQAYYSLLYLFFVLTLLACIAVLYQYWADYAALTALYKKGQVMPTPMRHIRFSLTVALAVAAGLYLADQRFCLRYMAERYLLIGGSIFMAAFLHLLAVRSGLLALYLMMGYALARLVLLHRKFILGMTIVIASAGLAYAAIQFIPTLQNKINYTQYTIYLLVRDGEVQELSDSQRLGSIKAGLAMAKAHPWIGEGLGDIRDAAEAYYEAHAPGLAGRKLLPHNQYVFVLGATGLLGLLYFVLATTYPLLYRSGYRDAFWTAFHLMIFSSFMVEHTLETQFGLTLYLLFALMGLRHIDAQGQDL